MTGPKRSHPGASREDRGPEDALIQFEQLLEVVHPGTTTSGVSLDSCTRVEAVRALAGASETYPEATAQFTEPVLKMLLEYHRRTDSVEALSAGERRRVQRYLCRILHHIAEASPSAFYMQTSKLQPLLMEGSIEVQQEVADLLTTIADSLPAAIDAPHQCIDHCLTADLISLQQCGCELVVHLCSEHPDVAGQFVHKLVELLATIDADLREAAIDAIHEVSTFEPETVITHAESLSDLLTDPSLGVRISTLRVFIEFIEVDHDTAWSHADAIVTGGSVGDGHFLPEVGVFFDRTANLAPEHLATRTDLLRELLETDSEAVPAHLSVPLRRLCAEFPSATLDIIRPISRVIVDEATDDELRADLLVALHWMVNRTGQPPPYETVEELLPMLGDVDTQIRGSAAVVLQTIDKVTAAGFIESLDMVQSREWSDLFLSETFDELSIEDGVPHEELFVAVREAAESEVGTIETDPPDWNMYPLSEYQSVGERGFTEVVSQIRQKLSDGDVVMPSALDDLVTYLESNSRLRRRAAMLTIWVVSRRQPSLASRYIQEVIPFTTDTDEEIRTVALNVVLELAEHASHTLSDGLASLAGALAYPDHATRRKVGLILQKLPLQQLSPLDLIVTSILEAMDSTQPKLVSLLGSVIIDLTRVFPEEMTPHLDQMFDVIEHPLDYTEPPGELSTLDSTVFDEVDVELASTDMSEERRLPTEDLQWEEPDFRYRINPLCSAIRTAIMMRPSLLAIHTNRIIDLLTADAAITQYEGVRLVHAGALVGDEQVSMFIPHLVEITVSTSEIDLRRESVSCLHTMASDLTEAVAAVGGDLRDALRRERPPTSDDPDEEYVRHLLETIMMTFDYIPIPDRPIPGDLLPFLTIEGEVSTYAMRILGTLADTHAQEAYDNRETVVEWCNRSREPRELIGAISYLTKVGSVGTLDEVFTQDE